MTTTKMKYKSSQMGHIAEVLEKNWLHREVTHNEQTLIYFLTGQLYNDDYDQVAYALKEVFKQRIEDRKQKLKEEEEKIEELKLKVY